MIGWVTFELMGVSYGVFESQEKRAKRDSKGLPAKVKTYRLLSWMAVSWCQEERRSPAVSTTRNLVKEEPLGDQGTAMEAEVAAGEPVKEQWALSWAEESRLVCSTTELRHRRPAVQVALGATTSH